MFAVTNYADNYTIDGYPTIFHDYDGYYRSKYNWEQYDEGSIFYVMNKEQYESTRQDPYVRNCWTVLYRMSDGTYIKRQTRIEWGDSIVNGVNYARVSIDAGDTILYRQEGKKVFCLSEEGKELLLMDYGLSEGDAFISPSGKRFVVTEKKECEDPTVYGFDQRMGIYPLQLHLTAEDGGEETWIEGVGSPQWGILPLAMTDGTAAFADRPIWAKVIWMSNMKTQLMAEVDEVSYKLKFFDFNTNYHDPGFKNDELRFSFIDDTLMIQGKKSLSEMLSFVDLTVYDNVVDIWNIDQYVPKSVRPTDKVHRYFEVRIPGFEAGIYQIGLKDGEHITVECKGATDGIQEIGGREIENSQSSAPNSKSSAYDLSGRRVVNPKRGLYIQDDGKKYVK